ncbi:hypothetical protein O6H91_11G030800 [Diphasiastrum complanatum]|uniref:Uncharacterized protein n=1 Tax=Diphasiastrum complanatum TaxID=34168 RepID=A0ACC2C7I3_DIPCM|nr:hypothetical protein O6H91_11G030800 [Diphasiastrum complanatum]
MSAHTECSLCSLKQWRHSYAEYAYTFKANEKSDIYSFGIVLLAHNWKKEDLTILGLLLMGCTLCTGFVPDTSMKSSQILDPRMLCSNFPFNEVKAVVGVALIWCSMNPVERLTMRDVVQMLVAGRPKSRANIFKDSDKSESPLIAI